MCRAEVVSESWFGFGDGETEESVEVEMQTYNIEYQVWDASTGCSITGLAVRS